MPIVLPAASRPELVEPTYLAAPVWKRVLAWAGVVLGGMMVFSAVITLGEGLRGTFGTVLMGAGMLLAGVWWLRCENADKKRADADHQLDVAAAAAQQAMSGYLSAAALAPLTWDTPLEPVVRRWPLVGSVAAVLFMTGAAVAPRVVEPQAPPTPPAPTVTTAIVISTVNAVPPTSADLPPEPTPAPELAPAAVASEPIPESVAPASVPAPLYAPAPEPVPAQQNVSYANCAAVRAAGAAPLRRGEPGYSSKLDRDNDGIACE